MKSLFSLFSINCLMFSAPPSSVCVPIANIVLHCLILLRSFNYIIPHYLVWMGPTGIDLQKSFIKPKSRQPNVFLLPAVDTNSVCKSITPHGYFMAYLIGFWIKKHITVRVTVRFHFHPQHRRQHQFKRRKWWAVVSLHTSRCPPSACGGFKLRSY